MDMPRLRSTLTKLRAVPFTHADDYNEIAAPQEMLDFLAMMVGIKPVYLLGRGMDDPGWVAGVTALARSLKLHVVRGPWWQAPTPSVLPDWYRTEFENKSGETAVYITKTPATAREVEAICARQGRITIAEESRLLGYPICCVEGHYARQIAMDELFGLLLQRVSGGDEEMMRRIAQDDVQMSIETEEEAALHQRVNGSSIVPFTSVMSCPACSAAADSPAQKLSQRFEELARSVGRGLLDDVQASQRAYNEEQAD